MKETIHRYLFSWDNVPGNDSKKLLGFLKDDLDIDWAENAEISKSDDGKIIHISKNKNSAKIMIDEKEEKATIKISDGRTHDLKVKKENGKLNIYSDRKDKERKLDQVKSICKIAIAALSGYYVAPSPTENLRFIDELLNDLEATLKEVGLRYTVFTENREMLLSELMQEARNPLAMLQYMPSHVAESTRMSTYPEYSLWKLGVIKERDVVKLLAHRARKEEWKRIHSPLEGMVKPEYTVREMVEPTEGAKAGDRIRYVQFTGSMQSAPRTPYPRAGVAYNRYKGIDTGVLTGRTITEARERDIEKIAKEMDKEVTLGKPLPEDELLKRTMMYRNAAVGLWQEEDDLKSMDVTSEIHWKRTVAGFQPWKKVAEIKSRKKDVGVKDLELFTGWL